MITYRETLPKDIDELIKVFGDVLIKYSIIKIDNNSFNYLALNNNKIIGLICVEKRHLIPPIQQDDAFITFIEIHKDYRKKGIATQLLMFAENWAKQQNLFQISGWSDLDASEMILLVKKHGYGMCQSIMYDENYLPTIKNNYKYTIGYNYAKKL